MTENYPIIYKILTCDECDQFQNTGYFEGTQLDVRDGYIHMSKNIEQVNRVKNKYYKDTQVVLVHIDSSKIPDLKYEEISNGDTYPHLYGVLKVDYVTKYEYV